VITSDASFAARRSGGRDIPTPSSSEALGCRSVKALLSAVAVEPLLTGKEPDETYAATHVFRLQELTALRRIADLKSRLQRTNPVEHATEYNRMFGELVALEQHRRNLRELAVGGS